MSTTETAPQEFTPVSTAELSRFLRENSTGAQLPVFAIGGRTALQFLGARDTPGMVVSTSRLNRVIDYPARDMTITVEAGIRITELAEVLAKERQQLPIDITHAHRATLGGAIACNVSGPRRFGYGTFRDYVIGLSAVDAEGRTFKAGGRVVKNVAGYDLCKLMVGSRGTLGVISQVTLKVKPVGESVDGIWCSCESFTQIDKILERLLLSETRPTAIEACTSAAASDLVADSRMSFAVNRPVLFIAYEGTADEVNWQIGRLRQELQPLRLAEMEEAGEENARLLLGTLSNFPDGGDVPLTFQAMLLPSRTPAFLELCEQFGISAEAHAGNGIVVGHLSDAKGKDESLKILETLSTAARESQGNRLILQADPLWRANLNWWGHPEPSWPLMRKIKNSLDPRGLLNPGAIPF